MRLCEDSLTVKTVFNNKTPCVAHEVKSPFSGFMPQSAFNSLKILLTMVEGTFINGKA